MARAQCSGSGWRQKADSAEQNTQGKLRSSRFAVNGEEFRGISRQVESNRWQVDRRLDVCFSTSRRGGGRRHPISDLLPHPWLSQPPPRAGSIVFRNGVAGNGRL